MLAHSNSIAFIATTQPERARVFYSEVWGLRLVEVTPLGLKHLSLQCSSPAGIARAYSCSARSKAPSSGMVVPSRYYQVGTKRCKTVQRILYSQMEALARVASKATCSRALLPFLLRSGRTGQQGSTFQPVCVYGYFV